METSSSMPSSLDYAQTVACVSLLVLAVGCGGGGIVESSPTVQQSAARAHEDPVVGQELERELSKIIGDASLRYAPLRYEYTEGLLNILDKIELLLSGKTDRAPPRFLPELEAQEELAHFRETVRRWEAKTGKNLRREVDLLKADVAARKPGEAFHPEFQRKFSQAFDTFIAIEVAELRERRNRAIHSAAEDLLAPHRAKNPETVRSLEEILNKPPYSLPTTAPS
jgi:hypothetical protein